MDLATLRAPTYSGLTQRCNKRLSNQQIFNIDTIFSAKRLPVWPIASIFVMNRYNSPKKIDVDMPISAGRQLTSVVKLLIVSGIYKCSSNNKTMTINSTVSYVKKIKCKRTVLSSIVIPVTNIANTERDKSMHVPDDWFFILVAAGNDKKPAFYCRCR